MTLTQKVILFALLAVGGLCLIIGLTLMHHIGGFLRTVEEEAREEQPDGGAPGADCGDAPATQTDPGKEE